MKCDMIYHNRQQIIYNDYIIEQILKQMWIIFLFLHI